MKALFNGHEYYIIDDDDQLLLEPVEGDEDSRITVDYSEPSLIIDPTCEELDTAEAWRKAMPTRK